MSLPLHTNLSLSQEWFYRTWQFHGVALGAIILTFTIALAVLDAAPSYVTWGGFFPMGLAWLIVWPLAYSPPVRRAFVAWLGRIGSHGEERQAAAVAGLIGTISPSKALSTARASFYGLPFSQLTVDDLASNTDTNLNQRTRKVALGACDAFMSHSWHDHAPTKWRVLQTWAASFEEAFGRSPMLWLESVCSGSKTLPSPLQPWSTAPAFP